MIRLRRTQGSPLGRFRLAAFLSLGVLVYGTAGYMVIERWSFFDALYMTVITVTTVGYGEVHHLSTLGRGFTMTLIVGGVGTILYALALFAELVGEGEFARYRRERQIEDRVRRLHDHFIVCGYGRMGTRIAEEFDHARAEYVVIDNNPEALERLAAQRRTHLGGDAASEDLLRRAGIERARALICAVDSDERAVYIVLAARAINPKLYILARAGHTDAIRRLELAGADRVISPYRMAGHQLAELALRPALVEVMDFLQHGGIAVGVEEILVREGAAAIGRSIRDAGLAQADGASVLAVRRADGTLAVNPETDFELAAGDLLIAFGTEEQLSKTAGVLN